MKHLAAYLLLHLGGNTAPSAADIKEVLASVGVEADDDRLETLLGELHGREIGDLIADGTTKLAVPIGGNASIETQESKGADVVEEHDHEKEGGSCDDCGDEDMGFDLFDL